MDQTKLVKILRMMKLLTGNVSKTVGQLSEELGISSRSVYRYIDSIREAGFVVNKLHGNVFQMGKMARGLPDFNKLIYFTEEEAYLTAKLIDGLDNNNALKRDLQRKLASVYDSTSISNFIDNPANACNIESLSRAIKQNKQVILKQYESANSNNVNDRLVEPYAFTSNMIDVCAYDVKKKENRFFKISRIHDVELSDSDWQFKDEHKAQIQDVFRMSGVTPEQIILQLNTRAKNLLVEEYPLAEKDLHKEGMKWLLKTLIYSPEGAGRFVIGLAGDIKIVKGEGLREYIHSYANEHLKGL